MHQSSQCLKLGQCQLLRHRLRVALGLLCARGLLSILPQNVLDLRLRLERPGASPPPVPSGVFFQSLGPRKGSCSRPSRGQFRISSIRNEPTWALAATAPALQSSLHSPCQPHLPRLPTSRKLWCFSGGSGVRLVLLTDLGCRRGGKQEGDTGLFFFFSERKDNG